MGAATEGPQIESLRIALVGPAEPRAFASEFPHDVASELPPGLGGVPVNDLGRALLDAGHRLVVVTGSRDVTSPRTFVGERLTIEVVPYRSRARHRALDLFRKERHGVTAALENHNVDVIHAHWTYEFAWGALASRLPVIVTAHDEPFAILRRQTDIYRLIRLAMAVRVRLATRNLTAVSPYLASSWRRRLFYRRPIAVVPNIAPFAPIQPSTETTDTFVVLDVANDTALKNVTALVDAFALVRRQIPEAALVLAGPGLDESDPFAVNLRARGLAEQVTFVGIQDREGIRRLMGSATVLAHVSLEEAQPAVLVEAMAYNLAIVAGRSSGGCPWTLGDGSAGTLVDVRSPQQIAQAIVAVHGTSPASRATSRAGHQLIVTRYSADVVVASYVAEYRSVVGSGHSRPRRAKRSGR